MIYLKRNKNAWAIKTKLKKTWQISNLKIEDDYILWSKYFTVYQNKNVILFLSKKRDEELKNGYINIEIILGILNQNIYATIITRMILPKLIIDAVNWTRKFKNLNENNFYPY